MGSQRLRRWYHLLVGLAAIAAAGCHSCGGAPPPKPPLRQGPAATLSKQAPATPERPEPNRTATARLVIAAPAGIEVLLSGRSLGLTRDDVGGLVVEAIETGRHPLVAKLEGYDDLVDAVEVGPPATFVVIHLTKRGLASTGARRVVLERETGDVEVTSAPALPEVRVSIDGALVPDEFGKPRLLPARVTNVPAGTFTIRFERDDGATIEGQFVLEPGALLRLRVDWALGEVVDLTPPSSDGRAAEERSREKPKAKRRPIR